MKLFIKIIACIAVATIGAVLAPPEFSTTSWVFLFSVALWLTELVPLPVTGLLIPALIALLGVLPADEAFSGFGNDILFLFIGVFLLAKAMHKHGLDQRLALWVLSTKESSKSPESLIVSVGIICFVLSMWISNTAAAALMMPLSLSIAKAVEAQFSSNLSRHNFTVRLLLITAFASSIGGIATPVGSPPNLIAIQFLRESGLSISFLEWLQIGLPLSLIMFVGLILIIKFLYPVEYVSLIQIRNTFSLKLSELGNIKITEIWTFLCFILAVILWIAPSLLEQFQPGEFTSLLNSRITMGTAAIIAAVPLFILKNENQQTVLTWEDATKINWGTILLFGGGITLGHMLNATGFAIYIANSIFPSEGTPLILLILAVALCGIMLSEFSSNTASASIIIPIILGISVPISEASILLVLGAVFGASFGFMLPVSTPPNAIVYGSGRLPAKDLIRAGLIFDLFGLALIVIYVRFLIPFFGLF